jgi:hypothetical protein
MVIVTWRAVRWLWDKRSAIFRLSRVKGTLSSVNLGPMGEQLLTVIKFFVAVPAYA